MGQCQLAIRCRGGLAERNALVALKVLPEQSVLLHREPMARGKWQNEQVGAKGLNAMRSAHHQSLPQGSAPRF